MLLLVPAVIVVAPKLFSYKVLKQLIDVYLYLEVFDALLHNNDCFTIYINHLLPQDYEQALIFFCLSGNVSLLNARLTLATVLFTLASAKSFNKEISAVVSTQVLITKVFIVTFTIKEK